MSSMIGKEEKMALLSSLHKHIRLENWHDVQLTLNQYAQLAQHGGGAEEGEEHLILRPNSVGFTAIHFTVLHCASSSTPNSLWWKWMILRVLAEYHPERQISPFLKRTEAGHTCTDLFFAKRLSPFPFETTTVKDNASRLLNTINTILRSCESDRQNQQQHHPIAANLRIRLQMKMRRGHNVTKYLIQNQLSKIHDNSDDSTFAATSVLSSEQTSDHNYNNELEEVMFSSQHVHETTQYSSVYLKEQTQLHQLSLDIVRLNEEEIQELIDFWYDMELLIMASVHDTIFIEYNEVNDNIRTNAHISSNDSDVLTRKWLIVHALSKTGCPTKIAKLANLLYPEQITQKDESGNLPLHIACSSHSTSTFAEGDDLSSNEENHQDNVVKKIENRDKNESHSCSPMIKCLLDLYPKATMIHNSNQQLPMTLALNAGKYWYTGIYDIFVSNPSMLLTGTSRDESTNLHSFMVAAAIDLNITTSLRLPSESSSTEEMRRAQRIASKKIGSMWRFLPQISKHRAVKEAKRELEKMKLTTIFELIRINPEACCIDK